MVGVIGFSIKGPVRASNDDYFRIDKASEFYAVADGIGSIANSRKAAMFTTRVIAAAAKRSGQRNLSQHELEECLANVANRISSRLRRKHLGATTVSACFRIAANKYLYCHVGDSAVIVYRPSADAVVFQTTPHTMAGKGLELWPKHFKVARSRPFGSNILTRSVSSTHNWWFDCGQIEVKDGDIILLLSDGALDAVHPKTLIEIALSHQFSELCAEELVASVENTSPNDNCSVVILKHIEGIHGSERRTSN